MKHTILLVDDEPNILAVMSELIQSAAGVNVETCELPEAAITLVQQNRYALVIADYRMPRLNGLEFFRKIRSLDVHQPVAIMSGCGSRNIVETALAEGVFDFVSKPPEMAQVCTLIQRAIALSGNKSTTPPAPLEATAPTKPQCLIGNSPAMKNIIALVGRAAQSEGPVLLTGEQGTGKKLAARIIHNLSGRKGRKLISIEWGRIPESFFTRELSGNQNGTNMGPALSLSELFNAADGGTVLLDEVDYVSASMQATVLSLIRQKKTSLPHNRDNQHGGVRIFATTTLDYSELANQILLSRELYHFLSNSVISLPPLRNRRSDISVLAHHFLKTTAALSRKRINGISQAALRLLVEYDWPGNVRELENVIERAAALCGTDIIEAEDIIFSAVKKPARIKSAGISSAWFLRCHERTARK